MKFKQWDGFTEGSWIEEVDVRNFIQKNYTPYEGDDSFLTNPTEKTTALWNEVLDLYKKEREAGGVLDISDDIASTISSHDAGYINKDLEEIVGLQTDAPLKRAIMPNGGIRIVEKSCAAYNRKISDKLICVMKKEMLMSPQAKRRGCNVSCSLISFLSCQVSFHFADRIISEISGGSGCGSNKG